MSLAPAFSLIRYRAIPASMDVDEERAKFNEAALAIAAAHTAWSSGEFVMVAVLEMLRTDMLAPPSIIMLSQRLGDYNIVSFGETEKFLLGVPKFSPYFRQYYKYEILASNLEIEVDSRVHHRAVLDRGDTLDSIMANLNGTELANYATGLRLLDLDYLLLDELRIHGDTARVRLTPGTLPRGN